MMAELKGAQAKGIHKDNELEIMMEQLKAAKQQHKKLMQVVAASTSESQDQLEVIMSEAEFAQADHQAEMQAVLSDGEAQLRGAQQECVQLEQMLTELEARA